MDEGIYFRNAYTPSPVCVPARQSFLSGLYPRNCSCLNFGDPMPTEVRTIPGHLGNYGYYACCAGKMHFVGRDVMHGWQERTGRDIIGNNGYPYPAVKDEHTAQIEGNNLIDNPDYAETLLRLRTKAEALPSPHRKDKNNCFTDLHCPIAGLN